MAANGKKKFGIAEILLGADCIPKGDDSSKKENKDPKKDMVEVKPYKAAKNTSPINDRIRMLAGLRAEAIANGESAMADAYQKMIDDEQKRITEEAEAAAKAEAEKVAKEKEEAEAAAKAKAEKLEKERAAAKEQAKFNANVDAIVPLIEYFLKSGHADNLIEAIASDPNGKQAILNYFKT